MFYCIIFSSSVYLRNIKYIVNRSGSFGGLVYSCQKIYKYIYLCIYIQ